MVFPDLRNVQFAEAPIFIGKIIVGELIAGEADKGEETMEAKENSTESKTGFLYCPRCGLRRPKSKMLGYYKIYCPSCGTRMIEEGSLPYNSKSRLYSKKNGEDRSLEDNVLIGIISANRKKRSATVYNNYKVFNKSIVDDNSVNNYFKTEIEKITEIIQINPGDFKLYFDRATMKIRAGDIEGARSDFRKAEQYHQESDLEMEEFPLL